MWSFCLIGVMDETIPLKKNSEFIRVYKKGRYYVGRYMVLYCLGNPFKIKRLGITTSKKVGKSVRRNRIRRLIRECYRIYEVCIKNGYDIVFVARENEVLPEFKDIRKEMKYLLKKLDVFVKESDCR